MNAHALNYDGLHLVAKGNAMLADALLKDTLEVVHGEHAN